MDSLTILRALYRRLQRTLTGDMSRRIPKMPAIHPRIVATIPHDTRAFTQGLACHQDFLYESTGIYGESSLKKMDLQGNVLHSIGIPDVFAEGIAIVDDELVQLTWREGTAFRYSIPDLVPQGVFSYSGEGWGLTSRPGTFIMSNGSGLLYFRDGNFNIINKIKVTLDKKPVYHLNDLICSGDRIYANVWRHNFLLEIDVTTGVVCRIIDCSGIVRTENCLAQDGMLNGIAYNNERGLFYVTGKRWKNIYIIEISAG